MLDEEWLEDNSGVETLYEVQKDLEELRGERMERKMEEKPAQRRENKANRENSDDESDEDDEEYDDDEEDSEDTEDEWDEWDDCPYDDEVKGAADHAQQQYEGILYAAEQAELVHTREEVLKSEIAAGKSTPLGP